MAVINNQVEIAVIGGGLIGMLTAYALLKSGVKIVIIEKSASASESSWAGGGILSPLYPWRYPDAVNTLAFKSQDLYPSLLEDIFKESGIDPEYQRCGMHILAEDIDSAGYQWLREHKIPFHNEKPGWNREVERDFVFLPNIAQVRNPRFIKSLKSLLVESGVEFSFNNEVSGFAKQANGDFVVYTGKGEWRAQKVIVCAGAWSSRLLAQFVPEIEIRPVRGQMLLYKIPEKTFEKDISTLISSIVLAKGRYIIPRKDGHVLVGSTMEEVGFDKATTEEGGAAIKRFVTDVCPDLSSFPIVKHWAGLRPGSPDGTPFIGEHPQIPGLYVNSGHFRNGVVMAPASAFLMRDLVTRNQPVIDPSAYSIDRYVLT